MAYVLPAIGLALLLLEGLCVRPDAVRTNVKPMPPGCDNVTEECCDPFLPEACPVCPTLKATKTLKREEEGCKSAKDYLKAQLEADKYWELFLYFLLCMAFVALITSGSFVLGVYLKPRPPSYWSNRRMNFLTDQYDEEVDVTEELREPVQKLLDLTTKSSAMGVGRDGKWATHKAFKVVKVTRCENGPLWSEYARVRYQIPPTDDLMSKMPKAWRKYTETALRHVEEKMAERDADPVVSNFLSTLELDGTRNERLMFHGSPGAGCRGGDGTIMFQTEEASPTHAIKTAGFDERLGNVKGMYGSGTYFADMASKCDQYAGRYNPIDHPKGTVGEQAKMFLARVTLGCPFLTNQSLEQLRRPPCVEGHFDLNLSWNQEVSFGRPWREKGVSFRVCHHKRFDSVMGDFVIDGAKKLYREYVVYGKQAYPEFCVTYERLAA